jgi:putative transposase
VDKAGDTIDFLLRAKRDKAAARRFFQKAMAQNGTPETVTIDKSGSNLAALHAINAKRETPIKVRQVKYLNNIVDRTIGRSNASLGRCWGSRTLTARASF